MLARFTVFLNAHLSKNKCETMLFSKAVNVSRTKPFFIPLSFVFWWLLLLFFFKLKAVICPNVALVVLRRGAESSESSTSGVGEERRRSPRLPANQEQERG